MEGKKTLLQEFMDKLAASEEQDAFKIYEDYAPRLGHADFKDQSDPGYWKFSGEAAVEHGGVFFYESRETLLGGKSYLDESRAGFFASLLDEGTRKMIAEELPEKCEECGFHRFWMIGVGMLSIGNPVSVRCPNCKKPVGDFSELGMGED